MQKYYLCAYIIYKIALRQKACHYNINVITTMQFHTKCMMCDVMEIRRWRGCETCRLEADEDEEQKSHIDSCVSVYSESVALSAVQICSRVCVCAGGGGERSLQHTESRITCGWDVLQARGAVHSTQGDASIIHTHQHL